MDSSTLTGLARACRRVFLSITVAGTLLWFPETGAASTPAVTPIQPYTGTFEIHWTRLMGAALPTAAASYAGEHRALVHWSVRDLHHWRADVQIIDPPLESGMMTGVLRGWRFTEYDARSDLAVTYVIPRQLRSLMRQYFGEDPEALASGSALLGTPGEAGDPGQQPDPRTPTSAIIANLLKESQQGVQGLVFGSKVRYMFHARYLGQRSLLGHTVDVIGIRPAVFWGNGCKKNHHTVVCSTGSGRVRLWYDHDHPFLLHKQIYGSRGVHDPMLSDGNLGWTATDITYGVGPSAAELAYQPPVPLVHIPRGGEFGTMGAGESGAVAQPKPFLTAPSPRHFAPQLRVYESSFQEGTAIYTPKRNWHDMRPNLIQILYSTGRHVKIYEPDGTSDGYYVRGPFLLIQERMQVHGLPTALQTGAPQTAGTCQGWGSTLPDGQHLFAFARGLVSVLLSSNVMDEPTLVAYVAHSMCR